LRAGNRDLSSVRPLKINEIEGDADDEGVEEEPTGDKSERIGLGDEERFVRNCWILYFRVKRKLKCI
jgi:hypothetical protein